MIRLDPGVMNHKNHQLYFLCVLKKREDFLIGALVCPNSSRKKLWILLKKSRGLKTLFKCWLREKGGNIEKRFTHLNSKGEQCLKKNRRYVLAEKAEKVCSPPASIPDSISEDTTTYFPQADIVLQQPAEGVKTLAMEGEHMVRRCLCAKSSRDPKYSSKKPEIQKKSREIPEGRKGLGRRIFRAILGFFALGILRFFYRTALRPWLSGGCRFYPSCSAYGLEALHKHTPLRALGFILGRLARCHPWGPWGYDPVPHTSHPETTPTSSSS